jgi:hypothetical protein
MSSKNKNQAIVQAIQAQAGSNKIAFLAVNSTEDIFTLACVQEGQPGYVTLWGLFYGDQEQTTHEAQELNELAGVSEQQSVQLIASANIMSYSLANPSYQQRSSGQQSRAQA